jgi:glycine/D-amino acid oxidase-like deaminating enzyme
MTEVVVIGGGILGLACAYHLIRHGRRVTILDRDPEGDRASHGNAGASWPPCASGSSISQTVSRVCVCIKL